MTTITALGNQKGGVGKTTVTLALAAELALLGRKVLVCDMDPQANTTSVLADPETFDPATTHTVVDLLTEEELEPEMVADAIIESTWPGVSLIAGHRDLSEFANMSIMSPERRLADALRDADLSQYDDVLIDLPPQVGRLALNGLAAADRVMIVTSPEAFSVDGIPEFLRTIAAVQRRLNPSLEYVGILVNNYDEGRVEHKTRVAEMQEAFIDEVLEPLIPRRAAAVDMVARAIPIYRISGAYASDLSEKFRDHARAMSEE